MSRPPPPLLALLVAWGACLPIADPAPPRAARADVTREEVERAIRRGAAFLVSRQLGDGSWGDQGGQNAGGTTALATLALLTAGATPREPHVARALEFLRTLGPEQMDSTYAVALQTMAFAAADPEGDRPRIERNAQWLLLGQAGFGQRGRIPGMWTYSSTRRAGGDNSNTQYALLGLNAAEEAGVLIPREAWEISRIYWVQSQRPDGGWGYHPHTGSASTGSMTCAGISSLVITGLRAVQQRESLVGDGVVGCGTAAIDPSLRRALDWLGANFTVRENINAGGAWKYYYLYGLERAGRLTGRRYFGGRDWYREGAEELVARQDPAGSWSGQPVDTSFALLFLAKGRAPVLINKLRHGPRDDWNNDLDDARHLVDSVARDWRRTLTWQVVDPDLCPVEDLLQAPIALLNGHEAPILSQEAKRRLREYIEQGGFVLADACCGRPEFDRGFRELVRQVFPEPEFQLHVLDDEHPVWRAKYRLDAADYQLLGIEHGCRTVLIYSPEDLSCYWNQAEASPQDPRVARAIRLGRNIVDYATGREPPPDKLVVREVHKLGAEPPRRGALQIAKLRHAGDWNIAPLAIPNLTSALRERLGFDVVVNHREIFAGEPGLRNFPLVYIHGRGPLKLGAEELDRLRSHLEPGGGTIFADAACGSAAFDDSFRAFVKELLPGHPLVPIPRDDEIYTDRVGYDLSKSQYSKAAGGKVGYPELEGVKLDGHWSVLYSKFDIGCALEHHEGIECKGYSHDSALKIGANIVIYATLP